LYSNILPIEGYNCTVIYCQNRYKTHKSAKFANGKPFIFTFRDREDSHCCTFLQKLFIERPLVKHSFTMVCGVNSLQRHKNKRRHFAENRLSPGKELLFPFYFETNYVAEPEQKKDKLQKGGGGSTKNKETRVFFHIAQYQVCLYLPFVLHGLQCSCQSSNLCRTAHSLFIRWLKRTNLELVVLVRHVLAQAITWCGYYEYKSIIIQFVDNFLC